MRLMRVTHASSGAWKPHIVYKAEESPCGYTCSLPEDATFTVITIDLRPRCVQVLQLSFQNYPYAGWSETANSVLRADMQAPCVGLDRRTLPAKK